MENEIMILRNFNKKTYFELERKKVKRSLKQAADEEAAALKKQLDSEIGNDISIIKKDTEYKKCERTAEAVLPHLDHQGGLSEMHRGRPVRRTESLPRLLCGISDRRTPVSGNGSSRVRLCSDRL